MNRQRILLAVVVVTCLASTMVLFTIFFLAAILFGFDSFWIWFFDVLKIFPEKPAAADAMRDFLDFMEKDKNYHMVIIKASDLKRDGMAVIYKVK